MAINVLIADDENLIRQLFVSELSRHEEIRIVGQVSNGEELLQKLETSKPDIILLDIIMPGMSGIEVLTKIKAQKSSVKAIIMSMLDTEEVIMHAFREGAMGFLCKTEDSRTIYEAINAVSQGEFYFTHRTRTILLDKALHPSKVSELLQSIFNKRELEIVNYIHTGLTSSEIAKKMYCSRSTVDRIRQELIHRVGAKNTLGLLAYCTSHALLNA
jgi:DNA-binding NarL/FixJ family response regulator